MVVESIISNWKLIIQATIGLLLVLLIIFNFWKIVDILSNILDSISWKWLVVGLFVLISIFSFIKEFL